MLPFWFNCSLITPYDMHSDIKVLGFRIIPCSINQEFYSTSYCDLKNVYFFSIMHCLDNVAAIKKVQVGNDQEKVQ